MTNTLHRFGPAEDFKDDYILFAKSTRGQNDVGAVERLRTFLSICARHQPVNLGDAKKGGLFRPSRNLNPLAHWKRDDQLSFEQVINEFTERATAAVVFGSIESLRRCLEEVKAADLGLSINIAAVVDDARSCCRQVGITPHAVEYSLGFLAKSTNLPDAQTLSIMTMCGHGMVSSAFARKMIEWVKTGRRRPDACAAYMSRFCVCGVFNPERVERLLRRIAHQGEASAEKR
jgi:hypothetical protein